MIHDVIEAAGFPPARPSPPAHLICFHHAGGASAEFRALKQILARHIPVTAVNLPGRESRCHEARHRDVNACATQLATELSPLLDRPHVLLGHSMGALVAYTIAQQRFAAFRRGPDALIVASCTAPHLPSAAAQIDSTDDGQLARELQQFGGLPADIVARPDWLAALLPLVRDDLRICASYRDRGEPPLPCPIYPVGGDADPLVTRAGLSEWDQHTHQPRRARILPGGHLLFRDPHPDLVAAIAAILDAHAAGGSPANRHPLNPVSSLAKQSSYATSVAAAS